MIDRLLDSEEHAGEAAIPTVAEDAAKLLQDLNDMVGLLEEANQNLISERNEALQFVEQVGRLSIWSFDNNDGEAYEECEEPSEGFLDSHCCLMALIEQAREIQKKQVTVNKLSLEEFQKADAALLKILIELPERIRDDLVTEVIQRGYDGTNSGIIADVLSEDFGTEFNGIFYEGDFNTATAVFYIEELADHQIATACIPA
jgi:hypothetical protein